jgi:Uma2 family endonuclease
MAVAPQQMTLEEFLALPEEKPALEYWDGGVIQKVSPKTQHSKLTIELADRIRRAALPHKIADVLPELRATFAGASVVPDLSVYRWERIPVNSQGRMENDLFEPPDIAIEIVSPEQSSTVLVRRCLWYVDNGVQIALLVDPDDDTILAFRPGQRPVVWRGTDRIDLSEVLPTFELTVEELFATLQR